MKLLLLATLASALAFCQNVPPNGGPAIATLTGTVGPVTTNLTSVIQAQIGGNTVTAGSTYFIVASGTAASTVANTTTATIRYGPNGGCSASDTIIATLAPTAATSGSNTPFQYQAYITFRSTTTVEVAAALFNFGLNTGLYTNVMFPNNMITIVTVNTVPTSYLQFCFISAASSTSATFYNASIWKAKA